MKSGFKAISKPSQAANPRRVLVQGGRVLNVFTGELLEQDILIENDRIVALLPREEGGGVCSAGGGTVAPTGSGTVASSGRGAVASAGSGAVGHGAADKGPSESGSVGEATFDEIIDATDRVVVPGYVEPHAHTGLMAEPVATLEQVARTGTTALVVDTYALMVTLADDELAPVLDHMQTLPTYVRWFLAPHARSFLVDEAEQFSVERLDRWLAREDVIAIGELTRWPVVAQGDPDILEKIRRAQRAGKRVEGHGAGASAPRLQRLLLHGVTSDHEGITPEQVLERVRLGFYTMLRHSSLRPDLPHLLRAFDGELAPLQHSNRIMLTVDGPTPVWMDEHGYLDNLIRICIEGGIAPAAAYRMATLNPAMYYRIEHDVGAIAVGRRADLNVLQDLSDPTPLLVMAAGRVIARDGELVESFPRISWERLAGMNRPAGKKPVPELFAFEMGPNESGRKAGSGAEAVGVESDSPAAGSGPANADGLAGVGSDRAGSGPAIPTLELAHTVLLRLVESDPAGNGSAREGDPSPEPLRIAVYDWDGRWMTRAFVTGFVDELGGLATSYSPAYQVTVFGQNPDDMAQAAARVMESRGGLCLVENGEEVFWLPLERAGLFTEMPWDELVPKLATFERLMRERGYPGHELLYTMFFFGFDSLPDYRLTVRGVWDVRRQRVVAPPLPL